MSLTICNPLAALDLGFYSCILHRIQASAWSRHDEDQHGTTSWVEAVSRNILALGSGLERYRWVQGLCRRIESGHQRSLLERNRLLVRVGGDPRGFTEGRSACRLQQGTGTLRDMQKEDWQEVVMFTLRSVEEEPGLMAWWELGFGIACLAFRMETNPSLVSITGSGLPGLQRIVRKLGQDHARWILTTLPATFEGTLDDELGLLKCYKAIRDLLPGEFQSHRRPSLEDVFTHNEDFSSCWWVVSGHLYFDDVERIVVRRLYDDLTRGGNGLSVDVLLRGTKRQQAIRLDTVFSHGKWPNRQVNPAWADGLIQTNHRGGYRLNLQGHKRIQRNTRGRTDSSQ